MKIFEEYNQLDLPAFAEKILDFWQKNKIFERSIENRKGKQKFIFYEGPPSANGMPGIHHVMARTIKDIFCRYKTLQGYYVERKAGWDTHGLPVELGVEKELGITKEDIGKKISIKEYNEACRKAVMKYTAHWNDLTEKMGYWVDMKNPYITYENKYIESVWHLLKMLYEKNLLYKGYTIQPYSPAAGTGLSSHELNQPGCYRNVKDLSATALFQLTAESEEKLKQALSVSSELPVYIAAWTTTPWTLPSNTALAVNPDIEYVLIKTFNPYTSQPQLIVLGKDILSRYFKPEQEALPWEDYKPGDKKVPYRILAVFKGKLPVENQLRYHQLLPYVLPYKDADKAFRIIPGDFVTTDEGTGIVHIAPTFGADDMKVAREAGVPPMLVLDENDRPVPLVDLRGRFRPEVNDPVFGLAGEPVKEAYLTPEERKAAIEKQREQLKSIISDTSKLDYLSVDDRIVIKLQMEGKLLKKEKYEHNYPHCWRTDKPVIYYPLDSWFIKVTAIKDRLVELNKTIYWKPESTGTGRFGNWLENANDWNLSRSRFWGIPLPVWKSEDGETKCIGSFAELKKECEKSVAAGIMKSNPLASFNENDLSDENYHKFDIHRPFVDEIILVSSNGLPMYRETDLIDVWFDSGAMPYAQWHWPFNKKVNLEEIMPADFIAEGVDQTRGWFYTLHVIATACFDSVAYKTVVSNGLVLDKHGQKMSKRLGNAIDPFETLKKFGPDATRWYMITNAQPWENLKFDPDGIVETQRKFFRAFFNTYSFFALYANIDHYRAEEAQVPVKERPELDRWILSKLNSLIKNVKENLDDYEPTRAARLIETFVVDHLSNWYVRLSRRRFWKGEYNQDKISAYQTLHTCLVTLAQLSSPFAPFFSDFIYRNLTQNIKGNYPPSVHLTDFPNPDDLMIDLHLEEKMDLAQIISGLVLSLRKKQNIRVRQPLQKMMIPVLNSTQKEMIKEVEHIILSEVNVKEIEYLDANQSIIVKKVKPDFKKLGPKLGPFMKSVTQKLLDLTQEEINSLEKNQKIDLVIEEQNITLTTDELEIIPQDIPGWLVAHDKGITVALDIRITDQLKYEGLAREFINRIQNLRKELGFEVTDKIIIEIEKNDIIEKVVELHKDYICSETLAEDIIFTDKMQQNLSNIVDLEEFQIHVKLFKSKYHGEKSN